MASHVDGTYKFWIQESVETNGVITDQQTLLHKEYGTWEITHQTNGTWKFKPAANFFGMTPSVTIRAEHGSNSGIWKDIEITNNVSGKPFIILHNKAYLRGMNISNKNLQIDVSLSDERNYAIANVVIFNNEK